MTSADEISIRRADDGDIEAAVRVCGLALKWDDGGRDAEFFTWKHLHNPFGESAIWLAEDAGAVVGVRAMMRWELQRMGADPWPMARAVDTATLPEHQGRGIFSRLTKAAVAELTDDGVAAIFNTPNDQSRPGYLKMGWSQLGRVPVTVRLRSPLVLPTMLRSKTAAEKWGIPTSVGLPPRQALADDDALDSLLASAPTEAGWSTPLSLDYLRWRTAFEPLACRVQPIGDSIGDGLVVFRLRQRGPLRQLSVLHVVAPEANHRATRRAIGRLLRDTGADVALASGDLGLAAGLLPLPKAGPVLTWRPLAQDLTPDPAAIDLPLGALELF